MAKASCVSKPAKSSTTPWLKSKTRVLAFQRRFSPGSLIPSSPRKASEKGPASDWTQSAELSGGTTVSLKSNPSPERPALPFVFHSNNRWVKRRKARRPRNERNLRTHQTFEETQAAHQRL